MMKCNAIPRCTLPARTSLIRTLVASDLLALGSSIVRLVFGYACRTDLHELSLPSGFGGDPDCLVCNNMPACIAAYISFLPDPEEGGLYFGNTDCMIIPLDHRPSSDTDQCVPNPLFLLENYPKHKPWLVTIKSTDAGLVRNIVRQTYTKTWNAFDQVRAIIGACYSHAIYLASSLLHQLINAVCPGGSVGLDSKVSKREIGSG